MKGYLGKKKRLSGTNIKKVKEEISMKYMVQEVQNMTNNNCGMVYVISHSQNTKKNGK